MSSRVSSLIERESSAGACTLGYYLDFENCVLKTKIDFLGFLISTRINGKKVAVCGAAAKGNTFLNYCGIRNDLIECVVDAAPFKQGRYLPGSHVPVVNGDNLRRERLDFVAVFPWNTKEEIVEQLSYITEWEGKFVFAVPELTVL